VAAGLGPQDALGAETRDRPTTSEPLRPTPDEKPTTGTPPSSAGASQVYGTLQTPNVGSSGRKRRSVGTRRVIWTLETPTDRGGTHANTPTTSPGFDNRRGRNRPRGGRPDRSPEAPTGVSCTLGPSHATRSRPARTGQPAGAAEGGAKPGGESRVRPDEPRARLAGCSVIEALPRCEDGHPACPVDTRSSEPVNAASTGSRPEKSRRSGSSGPNSPAQGRSKTRPLK
jgi:hypothetical protein